MISPLQDSIQAKDALTSTRPIQPRIIQNSGASGVPSLSHTEPTVLLLPDSETICHLELWDQLSEFSCTHKDNKFEQSPPQIPDYICDIYLMKTI